MRIRHVAALLTIALLAIGCDDSRDSVIVVPLAPTTTTTPTAPVVPDVIAEFRVTGALVPVLPAIVRVSSSLDGLAQVTAVLPWSQRVNLGTRTNVFLSLEAGGPGATGFLAAGIYLDGYVFREASSVGTLNPAVAVSGTYRR